MQIHVESSTACNAKCVFCVRPNMKRKGGMMEDWIFEKILTEAHAFGNANIPLYYMGEPLIYPKLFQRMQRLREERFQTSIFTNALALTPEIASQLISFSDIITVIIFSLNAVDSETYQDIMGIDYNTVRSNVIEFMKQNNGKIKVGAHSVSFSRSQSFIRGKPGKWVETWKDVFAGISLTPGIMLNYAGLIHDEFEHRVDENHTPDKCSRVNQMSILWDGRVNLCCMDPEGRVILGDVKENTLSEIFQSELAVHYREMHSQKRFSELPLCKDCNMNIISKGAQEKRGKHV